MSPHNRKDTDYLYHVTTYRRLETIAEEGLVRGHARAIGASALDDHARKGIFLTELGGVFFWYSRAEEHAEHGSDDLLEDGAVPVVLRTPWGDELEDALDADEIGSNDAKAAAYIAEQPIDGADLEVFDGKRWIAIDDWEDVDPEVALQDMADEEEEGPIWSFLPAGQEKLLPPEARK